MIKLLQRVSQLLRLWCIEDSYECELGGVSGQEVTYFKFSLCVFQVVVKW